MNKFCSCQSWCDLHLNENHAGIKVDNCCSALDLFNAELSLRSQTVVEGEGGWEEKVYVTLRCHRQNYFWIKMGSDEDRLKFSLIVRGKVTILSINHNF